MSPTNMLWDRKAQHHLLFNHFGSVEMIHLTHRQFIFLVMIRPLGLMPALVASAPLLHPLGCQVQIASIQSWVLAWNWGIFHPSLPRDSHILSTWRPGPGTATVPSRTPCLLSPLPDCAREKVGRGGGKGGAEGLNKTDQKALHFSPNTQLFND